MSLELLHVGAVKSLAAYVRPGRYRFGIALYDAARDQHSVAHVAVAVEPLKHDPLSRADEKPT